MGDMDHLFSWAIAHRLFFILAISIVAALYASAGLLNPARWLNAAAKKKNSLADTSSTVCPNNRGRSSEDEGTRKN
jgi:hypothetical protein